MDNNVFPSYRSSMGLKYVELLADEGFLVKETITSESEIKELELLIGEKKPLPNGIYRAEINGERTFVRVTNAAHDMTVEEMRLYTEIKQARDIRTIKKWIVFLIKFHVISLSVLFGLWLVIGLIFLY